MNGPENGRPTVIVMVICRMCNGHGIHIVEKTPCGFCNGVGKVPSDKPQQTYRYLFGWK